MKKAKLYKPNRPKGKSFGPKRNSSRAGYDKDWEKYRWRFLHYNPECYACGKKATVVDHIVPHKGDKGLFRDTRNHMPLCKRCHDTITGRFDRHSPPKTEEKAQWLQGKRDMSSCVVKIKVLSQYRK